MPVFFRIVLAACLLVPASAKPALFIIGDSTVRNSTAGQQGWGDPLAGHLDPAKIQVVNRAIGGRSSRTFLTEGRWDAVTAHLKPGDFVLIQFGHNDGGPLNGERARASLKGNGDETESIVRTPAAALDINLIDGHLGAGTYTLTGALQPRLIDVANAGATYNFGGSGSLGGLTALQKSGAGTLATSLNLSGTLRGRGFLTGTPGTLHVQPAPGTNFGRFPFFPR